MVANVIGPMKMRLSGPLICLKFIDSVRKSHVFTKLICVWGYITNVRINKVMIGKSILYYGGDTFKHCVMFLGLKIGTQQNVEALLLMVMAQAA